MQSTYELLKECEYELDILNGVYGTKQGYCILCKTIKYDGKVGLIHEDDCLIIKLRNQLKDYK